LTEPFSTSGYTEGIHGSISDKNGEKRWWKGGRVIWGFTLESRTALFWVITRRVVVISYRRFGRTYRSQSFGFKNSKGCPETSVRNYHYSPCNNLEERSSQLLRGGSLNSGILEYDTMECVTHLPLKTLSRAVWYQYVGRAIDRSCQAQAMYIKLYVRCYQARVMWVEL
jgi:hypothetical protein